MKLLCEVLDVSRSVSGDRLAHLTQAGEGVAAALRPGDHAALVTFSHAVNLRVPLTGDMNKIRDALGTLEGANCATAIEAGDVQSNVVPPIVPTVPTGTLAFTI